MKNLDKTKKKMYTISAFIGIGIFLIYLGLISIIAPIIGLRNYGLLYELLNLLDYTIGIPYNLTVRFYEILGCVTSPCLLWNTLTSFVTYSIFGIIVYIICRFIKIKFSRK